MGVRSTAIDNSYLKELMEEQGLILQTDSQGQEDSSGRQKRHHKEKTEIGGIELRVKMGNRELIWRERAPRQSIVGERG